MIRRLRHFCSNTIGAAAAELALVAPLLLLLMFGAFEAGNFFLSEHVVQKGVRDASRYAARLPLMNYAGCAVGTDAEPKIQKVARTGAPSGDHDGDGTEDVRLNGWTDDATVEIEIDCDTSGTYAGVFDDFPMGVPVVTVTASVPYVSLLSTLGFGNPSLNLNASSQAAVFGA